MWDLVKKVGDDLTAVWGAVNPRLPLLSNRPILKNIRHPAVREEYQWKKMCNCCKENKSVEKFRQVV